MAAMAAPRAYPFRFVGPKTKGPRWRAEGGELESTLDSEKPPDSRPGLVVIAAARYRLIVANVD